MDKNTYEPSYFKNGSQTQKNGLSYPPKRIMYVWPNPLRWGTTWTYFRSSQKHLSIRCHGQLWFSKKCTQKMLFFQRCWLEKGKKKAAFFRYIFWKIIIIHYSERTNAFENFESMSKWFLTSTCLVIHPLFTSGGKINHFFASGNASWNN